MARKKRHLSYDQQMMGPEPTYGKGAIEIPDDEQERSSLYSKGTGWFYYFEEKKKAEKICIGYCKHYLKFTNEQLKNLKRVPAWKLRHNLYPKVQMIIHGWEGYPMQLEELNNRFYALEKEGAQIAETTPDKPKKVMIPPAERTRLKLIDTLLADFDEHIIDGWIEGNYTTKFNCYSRFKGHGFKGNAIEPFRRMIEPQYEEIKDAYDKTCDQAVEAYEHIKKSDKRKMLHQFEDIFKDFDKLKASFKAQRVPRAHKRKTSDEQVLNLQYSPECEDSKLASINPVLVPGKSRLWVYNTKQRRLSEYQCESREGFLIAGTSIKNHDVKESRTATLRKPDIVLPNVLSKTEKQLEKFWDDITTKISSPNGRINKDCILMRVFE
jgi:hypothetical protein